MKRYRELTAAINKCRYCGSLVVTLNNMGQCPKGCPGNMREIDCDTYYLDMITGKLHGCITNDEANEEITNEKD